MRWTAVPLAILGAVLFVVPPLYGRWLAIGHLGMEGRVIVVTLSAIGVAAMVAAFVMRRRVGTAVVEVITVLVAYIVAATVLDASARSPQKRTMADLRTIATALEARQTDMNEFPRVRTFEELVPLLEPTYSKKLPRTDGFSNTYRYEAWQEDPKSPGADHYAVASGGHDWKFTYPSLRQYTSRSTTNYDCDIVYSNGVFIWYPEGIQQQ